MFIQFIFQHSKRKHYLISILSFVKLFYLVQKQKLINNFLKFDINFSNIIILFYRTQIIFLFIFYTILHTNTFLIISNMQSSTIIVLAEDFKSFGGINKIRNL